MAGVVLGNPEFNSSATLVARQPTDSPPASWGGTVINIIFLSFVSVGQMWVRSRSKQIKSSIHLSNPSVAFFSLLPVSEIAGGLKSNESWIFLSWTE